jgi:hypothetical protein
MIQPCDSQSMAVLVLPLVRIQSDLPFVLFSEAEGLVSGHEKATQSLRVLAAHLGKKP